MGPAGYRNRETRRLAVLVSLFALISTTHADAAGVQLDAIPSLRLQEGWRSNVYSRADDEVSSLLTLVNPALALRFTAPDNVMVQLSGGYERVWYSKSEAKEAEYNSWDLRVDSTGAWRFTPNFSLQPSVYYINTVDSERRIELLPSGDPILPPVAITDYGVVKTQDFGGVLALEYSVSPKVTVGISGNYSDKRFSDEDPAGIGLTDSTQAGGGLSFSYLVSPNTRVGLVASGNHYTFDNTLSSDTYSAGVRVNHRFTQRIHFDATLGGSHIRQESAQGESGQSKSTPSGSYRLSYDSEGATAAFFGSASYSGSSGFGEATRQYTVGASLTDRLTNTLSWNLSGTYQVSQSVFVEDVIDTNTIFTTVGLRYQPWKLVSLHLSGNMTRQEFDGLGLVDSSVDNYSANLGISISNLYNIY